MRSGDDIPVRRNGTNRRNRPLPFLDTDLIKIDDRTPEDFLDLTRKIAKGIHFDDPARPQRKDNWEDFFTGELGQEQAHQPHYALFLAFLELFQLSIDNLNTFTKRHLDFFYQKVLQFVKEPEVADKVHVVLALAKNIEEQGLLKGTRFLAGEDASGQLLQYELLRDTVFSQAKLAAVKQLYVQKEIRDLPKSEIDPEETLPLDVVKGFYGETVYEDTGEALDQMLPWYPFVNEDVPAVEMGWAVASPLLILHEGSREITFTITGDFTAEDALLTLRPMQRSPEVWDRKRLPSDFGVRYRSMRLPFLHAIPASKGWLSTVHGPLPRSHWIRTRKDFPILCSGLLN